MSVLSEDGTIDPDDSFYCTWLGIVTVAVLYNIWMVVMRITFTELREDVYLDKVFVSLDIITDIVFLVDILVHFHITYLEDGIKVADRDKLRLNYMSNGSFLIDVLALFPVHFLVYLTTDRLSYLYSRLINHVKLHVAFKFFDMVDGRTSFVNTFRAVKITSMIATAIHYTACLYYVMSEYEGFGSNGWTYPALEGEDALLFRKYIRSAYWSMMTLTTIGETPEPNTNAEYLFTGALFLVGVMIFAAVVGNVGDVIANANAARADFQSRIDSIKQYMHHRSVPERLQHRVKRWFNYSWSRTQALDEATLLGMLPDSLKGEIAVHIHMDTLSKVKIFENFETHVLKELVLKLRSQIFSPGDYIIRQGDVGREMFIIKHGKVKIFAGGKFIRTLCEGSTFGEIALLGLGHENDVRLPGGKIVCKRTADAQSVGYSEVFILGKRDLMSALNEYPEAKMALEDQAREWTAATQQQVDVQDQPGSDDNNPLSPGNELQSLADGHAMGVSGGEFGGADASAGLIELHQLMTELKNFDSQATQGVIDELQQENEELYSMLDEGDAEIHRLMERVTELESQAQSQVQESRDAESSPLHSPSLSPPIAQESPLSPRLSAESREPSMGEVQASLSRGNVALFNSSSSGAEEQIAEKETVEDAGPSDLPAIQPYPKPLVRRSQSSDTDDSGFADPSRWSRVSIPQLGSFDDEQQLQANTAADIQPSASEEEEAVPREEAELEVSTEDAGDVHDGEDAVDGDDDGEASSNLFTSGESSRRSSREHESSLSESNGGIGDGLGVPEEEDEDETSESKRRWQQGITNVQRARRVASAFSPDLQKLDASQAAALAALTSPSADSGCLELQSPESDDVIAGTGQAPATSSTLLTKEALSQAVLDEIGSRFENILRAQVADLQTWWSQELKSKTISTATAAVGQSPQSSEPLRNFHRRPSALLMRTASVDLGPGGENNDQTDRRGSLVPGASSGKRTLSVPGLSMPKTVAIVKGTAQWRKRANHRQSHGRLNSVDLPDVDESAGGKGGAGARADEASTSSAGRQWPLSRQPSVCGLTLVAKPKAELQMSDSDSDSSKNSSDED